MVETMEALLVETRVELTVGHLVETKAASRATRMAVSLVASMAEMKAAN